jgi:HTH-type transcriptional regulator, sugar sensing transcriptional regulator
MDEILRELMHLGLSEKEAAVYVASLELGPAPVQDISHKSRVNRATTYVMIESLVGRGLMSTFVKGKKRFYVPESPDRLRTILRAQRREIEEKENDLGKVLPMLLALFNVEGAKPQIRYLEGPEGLQTVRETFVALQGEYLQIVPLDDVATVKEIMATREDHLGKLAATEAKYRALIVTADASSELALAKHGEARVLPADTFPIHAEITVRENHVFLYSYRSAVVAFIIVSKEIADTVRTLFDLAWKGAEAYPVKKT